MHMCHASPVTHEFKHRLNMFSALCLMTVVCVSQALGGLTHMAVWIQLPLTADVAPAQHTSADTNRAASVDDSHQQNATSNPSVSSAEEVYDSWDRWHEIITLCDRNNLLGAVLEVSANLPPARLIRRWLGQPLRAVVLPTDVFTTNKRGYPVLSKAHQELVAVCYKHGVQVSPEFVLPLFNMPSVFKPLCVVITGCTAVK